MAPNSADHSAQADGARGFVKGGRREQTVEPKNKALVLDAMKRFMHALDLYAAAIATALLAAAMVSSRADEAGSAIDIRDSDIGGVVTPSGPEAGVWVIAELRQRQNALLRL
jgi:hypothetical protein